MRFFIIHFLTFLTPLHATASTIGCDDEDYFPRIMVTGWFADCPENVQGNIESLVNIFLENLPRLSPSEEKWLSDEMGSHNVDRMTKAEYSEEGIRAFYLRRVERLKDRKAFYVDLYKGMSDQLV
ncbi:MAG: hypothetical protein KDI13_03160 [Alphaproteobacteria bacterium]|nr:hypothetical protein [Alphaproteobacteria bacterium]